MYFLIKLYDETFKDNLFGFDFRSIAFWMFMVAFVLSVWQLSDWIYSRLNRSFLKGFSYKKKFTLLAIVYSLYGVFVAISFSVGYSLFDLILFDLHHYGGKYQFFDLDANIGMFMGYMSIILFRGQLYLLQQAKESELLTEKLKKENIQSQHQALKNQIDPHFFFNSMSVLTGLVYKNPDISAEYITQLSKMYRYVLNKEHGALVKLSEELEFLDAYIFLIRIRHNDEVVFKIEFSEETKKQIYLPPNVLQMLAENAIKHNRFSEEQPLEIQFYENSEKLHIKNNLKKREILGGTTTIGLENINKRYQLLCNKSIEIIETETSFTVSLPKINTNEHISSNF